MDTDALIAHARAKFDHAAARRVMREKYESCMLFGYRGGMFRATPEMIVFLNLYAGSLVVIKDLYDTPVQVDASELCDIMKSRLQEQMNAWLIEHTQVSQQR